MMVNASPREISTAHVSVVASAAKNWPTTPVRRPRGRKTTTVVMVDVVTGHTSSATASRMATCRSAPVARCRAMFSVITTASSITRPIAMAMAPSVIRLKVWPRARMAATVMMRVRGMLVALMAVMRPWRRKRNRTITARMAPMSMASRTPCTASRTSAAWS